MLDTIDRLIDEYGLVGKSCRVAFKRGRCQCSHIDTVHERLTSDPAQREGRGRCSGSHGKCDCTWFVPYDYAKENEARRNKMRAFAFAVIEATK